MNRKVKFIISLMVIGLMFLLVSNAFARGPKNTGQNPIYKTSDALDPIRTLSNINNWSYWMYHDGMSGIDPDGNSGGVYPRGTAGTIYQDGFVWGCKIDSNIFVGGQTYSVGTQALMDRIYRIRSDWKKLLDDSSPLVQDAAEFFRVPNASVTTGQTMALAAQYAKDWKEWPVADGAPFYDLNGNGVYEPVLDGDYPIAAEYNDAGELIAGGDYPGLARADQVVWLKVDDQDAYRTIALYGSDPIGLELQVTAWGYNQTGSQLGQVIFKKYRFINISGKQLDEMYVAQWSDPDVGNSTDDVVGCDPELGLGFAYNGNQTDDEFDELGLAPSAVGYDFLHGPIVDGVAGQDINNNGIDDAEDYAVFDLKKVGPGKVNMQMTSFGYFSAGNVEWEDPTLKDYDGTLEWYNLLRGFITTTDTDNPTPFTHRATGEATKFPLDGDPVTGIGDIDGNPGLGNFAPADRRIALSTGPFAMAPNDIQEVVVAVVGGNGNSNIMSVYELKNNIEYIQEAFNNGFDDNSLRAPRVSYHLEQTNDTSMKLYVEADLTDFDDVNSSEMAFRPQFGTDAPFTLPLYDDGQHYDQQAGDNIWGNNISVGNRKYPHAADLTLHLSSENKVYENYLTNVHLRPLPTLENWRFVWENRKQDSKINNDETVHLQYDICNNDFVNGIDSLSITKEKEFEYNNPIAPGEQVAIDYPFFVVTGSAAFDSVKIIYQIYFDHHYVDAIQTFPVVYWEGNVGVIEVVHNGSADASINVSIVEPDLLTGDDYKVFFDQQHYYRDIDGIWKETNYPDSVGKSLSKTSDVSPSSITGSAIFSETLGTTDIVFTLDLISPGDAWVDGIILDFPDHIQVNSWKAIEGSYGTYPSYGQNIINTEGSFDPVTNSITWGDSARSVMGAIEGTVTMVVNVQNFEPPITVNYSVYDDGYDGTVIDANGTVTIDEIGYEFKTERHWNLSNLTQNVIVLEDQTVIDGVDIYSGEIVGDPIADGLLITVKGTYENPITFTGITLIKENGTEYSIGADVGEYSKISDYYRSGWADDARSVSTREFGSVDPAELGNDYECRWTGVYKNAATVINGTNVWEVESGGSMASLYGARSDDLADHPLNPNPGVSEPFLVRIPFEVWNRDTGEQINISICDRKQIYDGSMDIYAFNPSDRMYTEFVNTPYDAINVIPADGGTHADHFTWNIVWWGGIAFANGDVLFVKYDGAISLNEYFLFTAEPSTAIMDNNIINEFHLSQNYPNPFNPVTTISYHLRNFSNVELNIYNILGQKVRTLINKKQAAGSYKIQFDSSGLASGVYVYRIKAGSFVSSKKMLLLK